MGQRNKKNYTCRIIEVKREVTLKDGKKVTRTKTKHIVPLSTLPAYAEREMFYKPVPREVGNLRNSPLSKENKKWIRTKHKFNFTPEAVELIKEGKLNEVIVSGKIKRYHVKSMYIKSNRQLSRA